MKNHLHERASQDVAAYKEASGILNQLVHYVRLADPASHHGFRGVRFSDGVTALTLRGAGIDLSPRYRDLWFWFTPQEGYTPSGFFSKLSKSGEPVIKVQCIEGDPDDTEALANKIVYNRQVHMIVLHEAIHYLDWFRNKDMLIKNPDTDAKVKGARYYNDPREFNAYGNNIAEPLLRFVSIAKDEDPAMRTRLATGIGISASFDETLKGLLHHAIPFAPVQKFWSMLNQRNRRALLKRLYLLHQEAVSLL